MSASLLTPKVFRGERNVQLSYEVSHRIFEATIYPAPSPNGSSIIIYAHENGIRFIWRGGRPFKTADDSAPTAKPKTNGASSDNVMIIDSDDENTGSGALVYEDRAEFEDNEEEIDSTNPVARIVQYLDLCFGSAALCLAVPSFAAVTLDSGPPILRDKLVIGVAFADHSVRIITLPLLPPSPASKSRQELRSSFTAGNAGNGIWNETVIDLLGFSKTTDRLSMTFTNTNPCEAVSSTPRKAKSSSNPPLGENWYVLVASHSPEARGLLLIHRIPIIEGQNGSKAFYTISKDYAAPFQTQYLTSTAITLNFNPSISQATQILLADKTGACRIYDCQPSVDNKGSEPSVSNTGSWLLTMYPGFQINKSENTSTLSSTALSNFGRKLIVDAKWAMGGKAVIVLLSDGEWGLWDIEGEGPSASKRILSRKAVKGGATTAFSTTGWVDGPPVKSSSRGATAPSSTSRFAPMTPGARKTTEPVLFAGRTGQSFLRGQISVARIPTKSSTGPVEECVAFWLEDSFSVVPNLRGYWEAHMQRSDGGAGNLFNPTSSGSRTQRLENVNLRGELCGGIAQYGLRATVKSELPTEILIIGEHRFIILLNDSTEPRGLPRLTSKQSDNQLITPGELDVTDINQALAWMENGAFKSKRKNGFS